jgi:hypothetical protein
VSPYPEEISIKPVALKRFERKRRNTTNINIFIEKFTRKFGTVNFEQEAKLKSV